MREGDIRELPINEGWNVLDDNLLAASAYHLSGVLWMLSQQKHPVEFTGGLEAKRLTPQIAVALKALRPKQVFFAYDTEDDLEPLIEAGRMMLEAGFTRASHSLRCFVLMGYKGDTFDGAKIRLAQTVEAGFVPMAMLWRDKTGKRDEEWMRFARQWARPSIICSTYNYMK
jgi:hypothetical protein